MLDWVVLRTALNKRDPRSFTVDDGHVLRLDGFVAALGLAYAHGSLRDEDRGHRVREGRG
jgi:hypothetical protein